MFNNKNTDDIKFNKLFTGIAESIFKSTYNSKNIRQLKEGEIVYKREDLSNFLYLILDGEVKIKYWGDEKIPSVMRKTKNDFFGEIELIENTHRRSSAIANTDCAFYQLSREDLYNLIEKERNIKNNIQGFNQLEKNRLNIEALREKVKEDQETQEAESKLNTNSENLKENEVKSKVEEKPERVEKIKPAPEVKKEEVPQKKLPEVLIEKKNELAEKVNKKEVNYSDIIADEEIDVNWNIDNDLTITNEELLENKINEDLKINDKILSKKTDVYNRSKEEENTPKKDQESVKKEHENSSFSFTNISDENLKYIPPIIEEKKENNIDEKVEESSSITPENIKEEFKPETIKQDENLNEIKEKQEEKEPEIPPYFTDNKKEDISALSNDNINNYQDFIDKIYEEQYHKRNGESKESAENRNNFPKIITPEKAAEENKIDNDDSLLPANKRALLNNSLQEELNKQKSGEENNKIEKVPEETKAPQDTPAEINTSSSAPEKSQSTHDEVLPVSGAVSLNIAANDFLNILAIYTNNRKVKLYKKYESDVKVNIDNAKIYNVFYEIIKNACDAMPDGGKVFVTIKEPKQSFVDIIFKDTGIGVPESIKQEILEPFVFSNTNSEPELGLEIVKQVLDEHNAKFNLESELGEGASFVVSLPAVS